MEKYREKLKLQNLCIAIGCLVLTVVAVLSISGVLEPAAKGSHWADLWNGFVFGAAWGLLLMMIFSLVRNILALCNETRLKKLYAKEHDERSAQIIINARSLATQVFLLLGLVAVIVAGYFNATVSITILACVLALSLLAVGFKLYYHLKF